MMPLIGPCHSVSFSREQISFLSKTDQSQLIDLFGLTILPLSPEQEIHGFCKQLKYRPFLQGKGGVQQIQIYCGKKCTNLQNRSIRGMNLHKKRFPRGLPKQLGSHCVLGHPGGRVLHKAAWLVVTEMPGQRSPLQSRRSLLYRESSLSNLQVS